MTPRPVPKDARAWHSRYHPDLEADRFVAGCLGGRRPSLVFIVGAGPDHLSAAVRRSLRGAYIASLQPDDAFAEAGEGYRDSIWYPSCGVAVSQAVDEALRGGTAAGGVAVLEWKPVTSSFPEASATILRTLGARLEAESSLAATTTYWARRWLRNSARFAARSTRFVVPTRTPSAVTLACAGPGLDAALPALREAGDGPRLWALASALPALYRAGLEPDMAIVTDPGFWSTHHARTAIVHGTMLAAPPSAMLPSAFLDAGLPIMVLDTGLAFERDAIEAAACPALAAVPSGTAAGTAIEAALALSDGPVLVVGLDLASRGLADHACPYAFDELERAGSNRLSPWLSRRLGRVVDAYPVRDAGWRLSRAFSTYAREPGWPSDGRVMRFSDSPVTMRGPALPLSGLRAALHDAVRSGEKPGGTRPVVGMAAGDAATRAAAFARLLSERVAGAIVGAEDAVRRRVPVDAASALVFKALAGAGAAELLALAARGEADASVLERAVGTLRAGMAEYEMAEP